MHKTIKPFCVNGQIGCRHRSAMATTLMRTTMMTTALRRVSHHQPLAHVIHSIRLVRGPFTRTTHTHTGIHNIYQLRACLLDTQIHILDTNRIWHDAYFITFRFMSNFRDDNFILGALRSHTT